MCSVSLEEQAKWFREVIDTIRTITPMKKLQIVMDEAQVLLYSQVDSFLSETAEETRPLLHAVVGLLEFIPDGALTLSGTGLSLAEVTEVVGSQIGKKNTAIFVDFGIADADYIRQRWQHLFGWHDGDEVVVNAIGLRLRGR